MLLEGSDRPLKSVAYDCGFGTADRMRVVFSERLGVTPPIIAQTFEDPNHSAAANLTSRALMPPPA
jgi:transcriptional regulator GlxA family with amidase domain